MGFTQDTIVRLWPSNNYEDKHLPGKHSPHQHTTTTTSTNCCQGKSDPQNHSVETKPWPHHLHVRAEDSSDQSSSLTQRFPWPCALSNLRSLYLSVKTETWCGLLLLNPIHLKVRGVVQSWDAILLTMVVKSHYLSYLLSDKPLLLAQLPPTGCFCTIIYKL